MELREALEVAALCCEDTIAGFEPTLEQLRAAATIRRWMEFASAAVEFAEHVEHHKQWQSLPDYYASDHNVLIAFRNTFRAAVAEEKRNA